VVQDTTQAGVLLVDALLNLVRDKPSHSQMLQPTLAIRASSVG
jgi:DNA-binding LacI/PurR family transcriptional regulator